MSYYLFLDDERYPQDVSWVPLKKDQVFEIVRSYSEFVDLITSNGTPTYVSFDHDLADVHYQKMLEDNEKFQAFVKDSKGGLTLEFNYGNEKTGYDCAKWLVDYCYDKNLTFPEYQVHSMNPIGRTRITQYIENARKNLKI